MDSWDILLDVTGERELDGQKCISSMLTPGRLVHDGGRYSVEFEELPVTGMESPVTRFTVDGGDLWMSHTGPHAAELCLQEKKVYGTAYMTPFGVAQMSILPTRIASEIGPQSGRIELEYVVFVGEDSAWNHLAIRYRLQENGEGAE